MTFKIKHGPMESMDRQEISVRPGDRLTIITQDGKEFALDDSVNTPNMLVLRCMNGSLVLKPQAGNSVVIETTQ